MLKSMLSFCINKYEFILAIEKNSTKETISVHVLLRLKKLLIHNKFLKKLIGKNFGKVLINFPSGPSIIDETVIIDILKLYFKNDLFVNVTGGISGSVPNYLKFNSGKVEKKYFVQRQNILGVNFNIKRPLRKFVFKKLINKYPKTLNMNFDDISEFLKSEKSINFFLRYGDTKIKIYNIDSCPSCKSDNSIKLYHSDGNTILGFLPNTTSYYKLCQECELVYLSKQISKRDLKIYYQDFSYGRKSYMSGYLKAWNEINEYNSSHYSNYLHGISNLKNQGNILDLGSGDGRFVALARKKNKKIKITAVDWFMPKELQKALNSLKISTYSSPVDAESLNKIKLDNYDLITMWEVVEHLKIKDLKNLLRYLDKILKKNGILILSTPDFNDPHCKSLDFWSMAAGEHLSVFNEKSLSKILDQAGYYIEQIERESVTIKMANAWYKYGYETNANISSQGSALMIEHILNNNKLRNQYKNYCRKKKIGSEMILFVKKKINNTTI